MGKEPACPSLNRLAALIQRVYRVRELIAARPSRPSGIGECPDRSLASPQVDQASPCDLRPLQTESAVSRKSLAENVAVSQSGSHQARLTGPSLPMSGYRLREKSRASGDAIELDLLRLNNLITHHRFSCRSCQSIQRGAAARSPDIFQSTLKGSFDRLAAALTRRMTPVC